MGVFPFLAVVLALCGAALQEAREVSAASPATHMAAQGPWRLAYEVAGDSGSASGAALPVVFVHGVNSDRRMWHHQMAKLKWRGPRIALDLLGHGASDKPQDAGYSFTTLAHGIEAVLADLEIELAVLVGHSNGVATVREFYRLFPGKTRALVLSDGALRAPLTAERANWMRRWLQRPDFEQARRHMVEQTPRGDLAEEDYRLIKEAALATPAHVMLGSLDAMVDPGTWRADPIEVPVLMIVSKGPMQTLWTDENRAFAESLIPELEFQVWEGVSHFFPLERAAEFNRRIESFLERHGR